MRGEEYVCPVPWKWAETYQRLHARWVRTGRMGTPPPIPLVLAGWSSPDWAKRSVWRATIEWAKRNGVEHLIPVLKDEERYKGGVGFGFFLNQEYDLTPKEKPPEEQVEKAMRKLRDMWEEVAGYELAGVTTPIEITGEKSRRLLVLADSSATPPWGDWDSFSRNEEKVHFTHLRKRVQKITFPVEIDHIDFVAMR